MNDRYCYDQKCILLYLLLLIISVIYLLDISTKWPTRRTTMREIKIKTHKVYLMFPAPAQNNMYYCIFCDILILYTPVSLLFLSYSISISQYTCTIIFGYLLHFHDMILGFHNTVLIHLSHVHMS